MSNLIGKFIGYLFVAGIVLGPLFGLFFFGQNIFYAYVDSKKVSAKIIDCHAIKTKSGSSINRSWAPVAETVSGIKVKGIFGSKKKENCTEDIGKLTSVYLSNTNPKKHQINQFFQLWFYPLLFIGINLILWIGMFKGYQKKRRKNSVKFT